MNLKSIKESNLKRKLKKQLSVHKNQYKNLNSKVSSVAILTTDAISSSINFTDQLENIIGFRNTKSYSFKKFQKNDELSFKHFTEKDMNWKGEYVQENFKAFLETKFDLLIAYFKDENLYLQKAVSDSKAQFKVGFAEVNSDLFQIEIQSEIEDANTFLLELKKYLQIMGKL